MDIASPVRPGAVSDGSARPWFSLPLLSAALTLSAGALFGQSIPATAPSGQPVGAQTSSLNVARSDFTTPARHRAEVLVSGTRLEIHADNSSLNSILRTLAAQTGMKITGGVLDQRVFGTYGPGPADQVLSDLLEGTGTNMILRQSASGGLGELILSPRTGGPTPPGPSTFRDDPQETPVTASPAGAQQPSAPPSRTPLVPPLPFSKPALPPAATDPMQTPVTPDSPGIVEPPLVSPATEPGTTPGPTTQTTGLSDTTSGRTPDGPKTPQQIYEELQQLRQQQQQAQPQSGNQ